MAVADLPAQAQVVPSLKQAWTNLWPAFWMLLAFTLIYYLVEGVQGSVPAGKEGAVTVNIVGTVLTIFLGFPLAMGLTKAHLQASRGIKPAWNDFGYAFSNRYLPSIAFGLLLVIAVLIGFALLIIPGIYIAVKLTFAGYHFVDEGLGPIESFKASWESTKGRWWNTFGLALMSIPLVIAGALALGIGIFVSIPLTQQMVAVYWRSIGQRA